MKPYLISHWQSNNLQTVGRQCYYHNNPYQVWLLYRKCRNKALWNTFSNWECWQWQKAPREKWGQTPQLINQTAACPNSHPKWDPNWVSAIPTQSWQPRDALLLLQLIFRIKSTQPMWHSMRPGWIHLWRSYDLLLRDDHTGCPESNHCGTHIPVENCSWRLVNEHTLEEITSSIHKHLEKSQPVYLEMKPQADSENDDVDTQTSGNKRTRRSGGKHTRRKASERNQQLEMISATRTGQVTCVPASAPTWRIISATGRAPES